VRGAARLEPFTCHECGARVAVADEATVLCRHCGASCRVPEAYRRAVALTRQAGAEVERAESAWRRFDRFTVPRWASAAIGQLPTVIFLGGLTLVLIARSDSEAADVRRWIGVAWWLPLAPSFIVTAVGWWMASRTEHVPILRVSLAAGGAREPECRICGAPLQQERRALFVHCVYCGADNLMTLSARRERALARQIDSAGESATAAVEAARNRRKNVSLAVIGVGGIFGGLCLPVILWSLGVPFDPHGWMLLPVWLVSFFALVFGPINALDLYGRNGGTATTWLTIVSLFGSFAATILFAIVT
jgi:hypothetical protein